jgi:hypothetical protein
MTTKCSSLLEPSRPISIPLSATRDCNLPSISIALSATRDCNLPSISGAHDLRRARHLHPVRNLRAPSRVVSSARHVLQGLIASLIRLSASLIRLSASLIRSGGRLPHDLASFPLIAIDCIDCIECLPHQVWRTGCHMISRHLEAIDHIWFEIRDKHWGSRDSFKKGHRARISGEIDVDASVLLQADEGSIPRSSEGAAEAEVERACRGPDAPLPCLHTLTTAPWLACIRSRRRPGLPTGRVGELQAKERRWAGRVRACGARVRAIDEP